MKISRKNLGAQIYSFREYIKTKAGAEETFRRLADMGYSVIQTSPSIAPMPEEELRTLLDRTGLRAATAHENGDRILNETEAVITHLKKLGCPHAAIPWIGTIPTGTAEAVALAQRFQHAAEQFREAGLRLAYHNHSIELYRLNGTPILETIYANAPVLEAEFDTYWLWQGGADPVRYLERFHGRATVLHLKDYGLQTPVNGSSGMMAVGSGMLDWERILAAADAAGVEQYVVEHDGLAAGENVFDSFAKSAKYLERFMA